MFDAIITNRTTNGLQCRDVYNSLFSECLALLYVTQTKCNIQH